MKRFSRQEFVLLALLILSIVLPSSFGEKEKAKVKKNKHKAIPAAAQGAKLESKDFLESGCIPRKAAKNVSSEFINKVPSWYAPVASKSFYYSAGEDLINRSLGANEIPSLCIKALFLSPTSPKGKYHVVVGGYHHTVVKLCQDTGYLTHTCEAVRGSPHYHKGAHSISTIVATDNKRWILLARCIQQRYRDFVVLSSTHKPLESNEYNQVTNEVKNLGFDPKFVETMKYDKCSKKV